MLVWKGVAHSWKELTVTDNSEFPVSIGDDVDESGMSEEEQALSRLLSCVREEIRSQDQLRVPETACGGDNRTFFMVDPDSGDQIVLPIDPITGEILDVETGLPIILSPETPVFAQSNSGDQCEITAFRNFDDALNSRNPVLRQVLESEISDNGSSTEVQRIYRGTSDQVLSTVTVDHDAEAGNLSFCVQTPQENQTIAIGPDGVPTQFELSRLDKTISFAFDQWGRVQDVLDNGLSIAAGVLRNQFLDAATLSLDNLRRYQGLPTPFVPSGELSGTSGDGNGNGNGNGGNGRGTHSEVATALVSAPISSEDELVEDGDLQPVMFVNEDDVEDEDEDDGEGEVDEDDDDDEVEEEGEEGEVDETEESDEVEEEEFEEEEFEEEEVEVESSTLITTVGEGGEGARQAHIDLVARARGPQGTPVLQELFEAYADAENPQSDRFMQVISGALLNPHQRVWLVDRLGQMAQPDHPLSLSASRTLAALTVRQLGRNESLSESAGQQLERLLVGCGPSHDAIREQLRSEFDLNSPEGLRELGRLAQRSRSWDCPHLSECLQNILQQVLTDNSLAGLEQDSQEYGERLPLYREALAQTIVSGNLDAERIRELPGMPAEGINEFIERVLQAPEGASTEDQARMDYARLFAQGGLANVLENGYELEPAERYRALLNEASQHLVREGVRTPLTAQQADAVIGLISEAERVAPSDAALRDRFATVLSDGLQGDNRTVFIAALDRYVLNPESRESRTIASLHAQTLSDDSIEQRYQSFVDSARTGGPMVRRALAGLVCGIADGDDTVAPDERYSAIAAEALRGAATTDAQRMQISQYLLDARQFLADQLPDARPYDLSILTAANLVGGLPRHQVSADLLRAISQNYEQSLTPPDSPQFDNAREAMLAVARHWTPADAVLFVRNLRQATIDGLVRVAPLLPPTTRQAALDHLTQRVAANGPDAVHAAAARTALLEAPRAESLTFRVQGDPPQADRPELTIDRAPLGSWPAEEEWRAIWRRDFGDTVVFPGDGNGDRTRADFTRPRNEWGHEEYAALAMQHFMSGNATGLDQLRQLTYDSFAFNRHESVPEIWAGTAYLDAVRRYEAARAGSNSQGAHGALVDLISLDRSIGCPQAVRDRIQVYLYGERPGMRPAPHEITLAVQEWQVRQFRSQQQANSAFTNVIAGNNMAEVERGLNAFNRTGQDAGMPAGSMEWVNRFGTLRMLELSTQQLAQPGGLNNAERRQNVITALERLRTTVDGNDHLLESFGEGGLQQTITDLNSDDAETRAAALEAIQTFLRRPAVERMLNDGRSMASLPLSPTDLLRSGILTLDEGLPQTVRDFGTYGRLRSSVDALMRPEGLRDARALAQLQSLLRDLGTSPATNGLVTALGGREELETLLGNLADPERRQAAVEALNTALRTEAAQRAGAPWLRELASRPDVLTQTSNANAPARLGEATELLGRLVNPNDQEPLDIVTMVRSFRTAIRESGARNGESASSWVTTYGVLARLDNAFAAQDDQRRSGAEVALRLMLEGPDTGVNGDLIRAFGGRQSVNTLLESLTGGDPAAANAALDQISEIDLQTIRSRISREEAAIRSLAAQSPDNRIRPRGEASAQVGVRELLRSGALGDADLMQAAQNDVVYRQLTTALTNFQSQNTEENRRALRGQLRRLLERADVENGGSQAAQQLIDRLGGTAEVNAFISSLILATDETAPGHARSMATRMGEPATATLLQNMRRPFVQAPTEWTVQSMLRPDITQEQISQAIAGATARGNAVNAAYIGHETAFLRRPADGGVLTSEQREQALVRLEQAGISGFGTGGNDLLMIGAPEFRAVHQLLRLEEATDWNARARELRGLIDLADQGNLQAQEWLRTLNFTDQERPYTATEFLQILERGTDEERQRAWELMRSHLPQGNDRMDELRVRAIVREVTSTLEPTVAQLDACREALAREADNCNPHAQSWMDWTDANRLVARISARGGGLNTEQDRTEALNELTEMANRNPHARSAMFAILTAGHTGDLYLGSNGQFPTVPDLSHLTTVQRHNLLDRVARSTERLVQANPQLAAGEAAALAIAFGRNRTSDAPLSVRINSILERAWQNPDSRAQIMDGLYVAMMQQPPVEGRRAIADIYLRHADHPAFRDYIRAISESAVLGNDPIAMYVIAGALGRVETRADVAGTLERTVNMLAARPDRAPQFIQALRDRFHQAGDQANLLGTLGRVAASTTGGISATLRGQVLGELREAINGAFTTGGAIDGAARPTYASAMRGMAPLAAHWTHPGDFNALTQRMTPELATTLREAGRTITGEMADRILAVAMERARTAGDQQIPALEVIGSLSWRVTPEQVNTIGALIRDLPPADMRVQQAGSRALLQIINNITEIVNDSRSSTDPTVVARREAMVRARDAAVNFFTETGWAQGMGDQVRQALLNYARGEAVDPAHVGRITELAYDMHLRPPISHVLRTLGIEGVTPAQLQAAIDRVGGEQQFRLLLNRIQAYDALPAPLQRLVREGSTDVSGIQPLDLSPAHGGRTTRTDIRALITHLQTQGISGPFVHLGASCQTNIDNLRQAVLNQIAERAGVHSFNAECALQDGRERALTGRAPRIEDREARNQDQLRAGTMDRLCRLTSEARGTSAMWLLLGTPGLIYRQYSVHSLESDQARLIGDLSTQSQAAARARGEMARLQGVMQSLDIANDTARVYNVLQTGDRQLADYLILRMASEHSVGSLQMISPGIHSQLVGFGPAAWQQGVWGRLTRHQLAAGVPLPTYRLNTPDVVADACATLTRRDLTVTNPDWRYRELSNSAHQLLVHEALRALDTAPGTTRATSAAAEFSVEAGELQRLIAAGISGHRGDAFVTHIRGLVRRNGPALTDAEVEGRVTALTRQLESTTNPQIREVLQQRIRDLQTNRREDLGLQPAIQRIQSELPELRRSLTQLQEARRAATDQDAIRGLDSRIQALEGVINTFSPNSPQMRQFNEMFRLVNSGSFDASTLWRTLRDNAVPILLTIACAAAIIATCGTASVLAVVVGAALMSVSGLAINEGWAELSYQLDWNGTGGSQLGNAVRRWQHEHGMRDSGYMVYDYRTGSMIPGPTFAAAMEHYGWHITRDMALNLGLMGFGHVLGASLRWASGATREAAQLEALGRALGDSGRRATGLSNLIGGNPATQTWVARFMNECRGQVGFALVQHATHTAIVQGFNEQSFWTEVAAGVICIAGHTTMNHFQHYGIRPRMLREGVLELPINREAFMREIRNRVRDLDGVSIREHPTNGTVEVTLNGRPIEVRFVSPEVAIANAQAARVAAEGRDGQPTDATNAPAGTPAGAEVRRQQAPADRATEVDTTHNLSERARVARGQMDTWVDHANQGDYARATEHALNCADQLHQQGQADVTFHNVDIPIASLAEHLPQHLAAMGGPAGNRSQQPHASGTPDHVDIHLARPRLVLEGGVTVDLTRLSTERARLTEPQRIALDNALNSPAGQAIMRRAALQFMEEIIVHSNHILSDGRLSFIQAQFDALVVNPPGGRRDGAILREWQANGAEAHGDGFSAVRAEQEVLALMYERGASWEMIMAVAGNSSHRSIRENMVAYLRALEAGHAPVAATPPTRLPGSPTTPHASERSGLPRRLFEGDAEISAVDRQQMTDHRQRLQDQINSHPDMPPAIREVLLAMLPPEAGIRGDRTAVNRAANDLTTVSDIMRLPADIRARFLDPIIARMDTPTAAQIATAQFAHELVQAGVPTARVLAFTDANLEQIRTQAQAIPANIRRAFIDPILSQPFDQPAFARAVRDARAIAGEANPVARLDLMARRGRGTGAEVEPRSRLIQEMMLERLADYRTALNTPAESRTPEHQRVLDAFNRARSALGINHHVFEALVLPAVSAPSATDASMRTALERARQLSDAATARGITAPQLEAAFRLPAGVREMILDPLLSRTATTPAAFVAETAVAARYAERALSNERLAAIRDLPPETRRAFIDPVVAGDGFTPAAFDAAATQARTYHTAPLDTQITTLRDRIATLEARPQESLSAADREQLRTTREALVERMRTAGTRVQELTDLTRPRTIEEQRLLDGLRTQQAADRLLRDRAVDLATLARMTPEQINQVAALEPAIRSHFMGEVLNGRRPFENFGDALTRAREFTAQPVHEQMRIMRRELAPLESRVDSTTQPLTTQERAQMRSAQDLLFNRLRHASNEIQRLEANTNRNPAENTALERARTALREEIAHMERNCDIGTAADGTAVADSAALDTRQLILDAINAIRRDGGHGDYAVIRTRGSSAMDGLGYDFVVIDRRTGRFIGVDASARNKLGDGDYTGVRMRENSVVHIPDNCSPIERARLLAQVRSMVEGIAHSPLNVGEIRLPFDQAHTAPTVRRLTAPEIASIREQVNVERRRYERAHERWENGGRQGPEPLPNNIPLPSGEVVPVPIGGGDPQIAMRRDTSTTIADTRRETNRLTEVLNGSTNFNGAETATRLERAIAQAEPYVRERLELTEQYMRDLQARETAAREAGRHAEARDLAALREQIGNGAHTYAQDLVRDLARAREALQRWRDAQSGTTTTPPPAPPVTTPNPTTTGGGGAHPRRTLFEGSSPEAIAQEIRQAPLPERTRNTLARYAEAHPESAPLMQRAARVPAEHLTAAGVERAVTADGATSQRIELAVRHAEVLAGIEHMPPALREGLRQVLVPEEGRSRPNARQIGLVEDILRVGHENIPETVRRYLENPELLDAETIGTLRQLMRQAVEAQIPVQRPASPAEELTPQRRRALIAERFSECGDLSMAYSPEMIARAQAETARILTEHMPGAVPVEVNCGANQIAIILQHPDGRRTVLKLDTRGPMEWRDTYGTREFDCPTIPFGGRRTHTLGSGSDRWLAYQQPYGTPASDTQIAAFNRLLRRGGRQMGDGGVAEADRSQIRIVNGQPRLIDYDAVRD